VRRVAAVLAVAAAALALPAAAWGHAALVRTVPSASGTVNRPPGQVALTFTEAVEPRFAAISVTDAKARQLIRGRPRRAPGDPNTLTVGLNRPKEGWYLVYWRVVSVDGHPVRGAFTFAVGPNPGPAPEFVIPPVSETAATPRLLAARWVALLSAMLAVGLFVMRMLIARPLKPLSLAWGIATAVALLAAPVYVVLATAQFSLRSAFDLSALAPLLDASEFGKGYLDLELCLALFALAGAIAIRIDRPDRPRRSIAELAATAGALLAAAAVLLVPGVSGHAGHTSPRGEAIALDWVHLAAGSIWIGGLAGLLVLWRAKPAALAVVVPRFSAVALGSVLALMTTGTLAAILHLPTLASLWETSYGRALLAKIALLCATLLIAAVNLLRTRPRLIASRTRPELGAPAARLLRRLVLGETALVAGAVLAAAVLTSLAPPAKAIAALGKPAATVGPGRVSRAVERNGYRLALTVAPNKAAQNNRFAVRLTRGGHPVTGATVTAGLVMLDMEMGQQAYRLPETAPGVYGRAAPALVMVGRWGLSLDVEPAGATPFTVTILDHAGG
jgi:copper transport protein